MKKAVFLLLLALSCLAASAQNTVTVTGSKLQDEFGNKLVLGQACFQAVNNSGVPINYQAGGGGQTIKTQRCATVSNGAFSVLLHDTSRTSPTNVCYHLTVKDTSTNQWVLGVPAMAGQPSGYDCLQPQANPAGGTQAATWCSSGSCNFDQYPPNLAPLSLVQTGPTGPQGPQGIQGPQGQMALMGAAQGSYSGSITYSAGAVATYGGNSYASLISGNLGHQPDISPAQWGQLVALNSLPVALASQSQANPQPVYATTVTTVPANAVIVAEGDSRTAGGAVGCPGSSPTPCAYTWPAYLVGMSQFYGRTWHNEAVNGSTVNTTGINAVARYAANVKPYCQAATASAPAYLFFWSFYNDVNFGNQTGSQVYAAYKNYMLQARTDGCTPVAMTEPQTSYEYTASPDPQKERVIFNNLMRADSMGTNPVWKYMIDLDAMRFNPNGSMYAGDGIHFSIAGEYAVAALVNQVFGGQPWSVADSVPTVSNANTRTGDLIAAQNANTGVLWVGSDGTQYFQRNGAGFNGVVFSGGCFSVGIGPAAGGTGSCIAGMVTSATSSTAGAYFLGSDGNVIIDRTGANTTILYGSDWQLPNGGANIAGAAHGLLANSLSIDWNSGGRVLATGPNGSTAASLNLTTVSSNAAVFNYGIVIDQYGNVHMGKSTSYVDANGVYYASSTAGVTKTCTTYPTVVGGIVTGC